MHPPPKRNIKPLFFIAVLLIYAAINCFMNYKLKTTPNRNSKHFLLYSAAGLLSRNLCGERKVLKSVNSEYINSEQHRKFCDVEDRHFSF